MDSSRCPAPSERLASRRSDRVALVLLALHSALLLRLAATTSPTMDEPGHLAAGLAFWRFGDTFLFRVNPPLVKAVAALPTLALDHREDWSRYEDATAIRWEWPVADDLALANERRFFLLLFAARMACIPFSLLGGWVCYRWAGRLYGGGAGLAALAIWSFNPMTCAEAALITTDTGAAALGVLAGYRFWLWTRHPTPRGALWAGLAVGLACLAKFTWLPVVAAWATLGLLAACRSRRPRAVAIQLVGLMLAAGWIFNLGYGFDRFGERLGAIPFASDLLGGPGTAMEAPEFAASNRFRETRLAGLPLPIPANALRGIDQQAREFERGKWCYLLGRHQFRGWWYFYLAAGLCKLPVGLLGLLTLRGLVSAAGMRLSTPWDALCLLTPPVALLALLASQTGFTTYFRYALPAVPFLAILSAGLFGATVARRGVIRGVTWLCLGLTIGSTWAAYPHYLGYFSEWTGGAGRGHLYLGDSNLDRGQDLFRLEDWAREPGNDRPLLADLEIPLPLEWYALRAEAVREIVPSRPGRYAVSMARLFESGRRYEAFLRAARPVARVGTSILIYDFPGAGVEKSGPVGRKSTATGLYPDVE